MRPLPQQSSLLHRALPPRPPHTPHPTHHLPTGVSVSSLQRSHVIINPPALPEAAALRTWWESEGSGAATVHAGAGLATALK